MPKKIYMSTDSADLANFSYKGVYVSLTIDTRKWVVTKRDDASRPTEHYQSQQLSIVLRVTKDSKRLYLAVGERCTWREWLEMCKHEQSTRVGADSERRATLKQYLAKIKPVVYEMVDAGTFSFARMKDRYNGAVSDNVTIYSVWDEIIQRKRDDDKAGTARCNVDILNRFKRDMGMDVAFSEIGRDFIQKPSPTWARHSFATNLNNSGNVPYKYISDSMGHSGNGDITSNYIGAYPLEKCELYKTKCKNQKFLSFIKDKLAIFVANFIYKRYECNCKTKLS